MRKAAIGLALILILLVAGLLAAPYVIGLDRFKAVIAAQVEQRIGRPIDIAGPLRLVMLPTPSLSLRDLRLVNPPGAAAGDMIRIRAVDVKLALWPLLAGRVEVRSAELIDPDLDLERLPDGTENWRPVVAASVPAGGGPGLFVRRLDIENGTITYRSGTIVERLEHINATLELDQPGGPFRIAGDLVSHGAALRFSADGGHADDGVLPLHTVMSTKPAAQAEFDGTVGGQLDAPEIKGKLKLAVSDLASALATLRRTPASPALARTFNLSADLNMAGRRIALEHAAIDLGTAHGDGTIGIAVGAPVEWDLVLHVTRLDLDRWFEATGGASGSAAKPAASADLRTSPEPTPVGAFAVPGDISGSLDLSVEDLLWRGGIVRGTVVKATLHDGTLAMERLGALLPGSTNVSAAGTLSSEKGRPRADGRVDVAAADLRGLIAWLGYSVGRVPADRLRGLSLSSRVTLTGDQLDFRADDATLDATRFQAAASVPLHGKPGIGLHLTADQINLDAYLAPAETIAPLPAAAPTPLGTDKPVLTSLLGDLDADFDVQLGGATWRGQSLRQLRLSGTLQDGSLSLDELSVGDLGGAAGKLTGMVEGLAGGGLKGQLFFGAHGPAFERVLRLGWPDHAFGQRYGAFHLEGGAHLGQEQAELDGDLEIIGGHAHAAGTLSTANGADLSVTIDHPSFATMMHAIFPAYRPAGGDVGALTLSAKIKTGAGRLDIGAFSLAVGAATASGSAGLALDGARPRLTADVTIGDWAVDTIMPALRAAAGDDAADRFGPTPGIVLAQAGTAVPRAAPDLRWSRSPIDWSDLWAVDANVTLAGKSLSYGAWRLDQPAATIVLDDGVVDIGKAAGRLFDGPVEASFRLTTKAAPGLQMRIALHDADLKAALGTLADIKAIDGRFDLAGDLTSGGASQLDLVSHLDGAASFSARNGTLFGVDVRAFRDRLLSAGRPVDLPGLAKAVIGGTTRFSAFDGTFRLKDGVATGDDLHLAAEGADGWSSAAIDLPAWTIDSRAEFWLAGAAGVPPLVLHVSGSLDAPHESLDINALSAFLAQRAPLKSPAPHP